MTDPDLTLFELLVAAVALAVVVALVVVIAGVVNDISKPENRRDDE